MRLRKELCVDAFIRTIFEGFSKIPEPSSRQQKKIALTDCLMSCFAMFHLKWPSLLQYDIRKRQPKMKKNLKNLYKVDNAPSDTYMRERLDELDPSTLRPAFKKIFAQLQRGKALEPYRTLHGHHLISIDGMGHFSSSKVHCKNCCVKHHHDGSSTYYHQMLSAVVVHPDLSQVIPLCPEPIINHENTSKNDCEQNASRRLLPHIRREHPHLKIIVVQDALGDCGPNVKQLESLSMKYIIVRKGEPLKWRDQSKIEAFEFTDENGIVHRYRFRNGDPLNGVHSEVKTNILEHRYTNKKGKERYGCWITNIPITTANAHQIMRGGRARWKIENETFNTLKNQGYNFEHNYGHGDHNLCTVMGFLMLLAFLVDQSQDLSCAIYKAAREEQRTFYELFETTRVFFKNFIWNSWEDFLRALANIETLNSS